MSRAGITSACRLPFSIHAGQDDADTLRTDPLLKLVCRRLPNAQALTNGQTTGAIDAKNGSGVPAGARAAYCAVQSYGSATGPLTLFPAGTSDPGIANYVSTVPGVLNMMYMLMPLNASGQFQIYSYLTTSVYVDVWGYLY